uniref:RING-type domain-containing protein n=1 Tax=Oryza punctata TaxID=4537 RepID=A0A0E0LHC6_ORYPU
MGGAGGWFVVVEGGASYKTNRSSAAIAGLCVAAGVLLMVGIMLLCKRVRTSPAPPPPPQRRRDEGDYDDDIVVFGIDEATLQALPLVLYGEVRTRTTQTCCAVCLESYGDGDVLRALPECGHLFHRECIFTWLRRRPTCPVCRTSPSPTSPTPTPLADVLGLLSV